MLCNAECWNRPLLSWGIVPCLDVLCEHVAFATGEFVSDSGWCHIRQQCVRIKKGEADPGRPTPPRTGGRLISWCCARCQLRSPYANNHSPIAFGTTDSGEFNSLISRKRGGLRSACIDFFVYADQDP